MIDHAILRQLSGSQSEDGFQMLCQIMDEEAENLRQHEGLLCREVARLAFVVPPGEAYAHPAVLAAARRLEAETGCLLVGPALGWMLHAELSQTKGRVLPNPLTQRLLPS